MTRVRGAIRKTRAVRPRRLALVPTSQLLAQFCQERFSVSRKRLMQLMWHWETICGAAWAAKTYPFALSPERQGVHVSAGEGASTLRVAVPHAHALEVSYAGEELKERVNRYIGAGIVRQVRIKSVSDALFAQMCAVRASEDVFVPENNTLSVQAQDWLDACMLPGAEAINKAPQHDGQPSKTEGLHNQKEPLEAALRALGSALLLEKKA